MIIENLEISLKDSALQWYKRNIDDFIGEEYELNDGAVVKSPLLKFKDELKNKFITNEMNRNLIIWTKLRQNNQSFENFGTSVKEIGNLLGQAPIFQVQKFKEGINDDYIKGKMMTFCGDSLEKAISKAKQYEIKKRYQLPNMEGRLNSMNIGEKDSRKRKGKRDLSRIKCYNCQEMGHYARNCPKKNSGNSGVAQNSIELNELKFNEQESLKRKLQQIDIKICGKKFSPMLDTGAQIEVIRLDLFKLLKKRYEPIRAKATGISNDETVELIGTCSLEINLGNTTENISFYVVPNMRYPMVLGIFFLKKINAKWGFNENFIEINGELIKTYDIDDSRMIYSINELKIIEEHPKFFKKITFDEKVNPVDVTPHKVELIENSPIISAKVAKYPKVLEEEIAEEGRKFIKAGWLKPAEGNGNLLNLVPIKKNGKLRMTTNAAPLNKYIKDYTYPMKVVDDMLQLIEGFKFLSIFDMEKGYFQIPLAPESMKLFRVNWPGIGVVCWKVMVQGDKTAPGKFQHEMDKICLMINNSGKLSKGTTIAVIMDDVAVVSKSNDVNIHYKDLKFIFGVFEKKGWRANPDKSFLFRVSAKWLGHMVDKSAIKPLDSKVEGLKQIGNFKTSTDVKRFLGMVNEYRKFIPNLAGIAEPLYDLTRSKSKFGFDDPRVIDATKLIVDKLSSSPILKLIDVSKPFTIQSDASDYASGAVLLQPHDGILHPTWYTSKSFNASERNYSTGDKELLAIKLALKKFKYYIWGNNITVITDHKPNETFLQKNPADMVPRQRRWLEIFNEFNIQIIWSAGKNLTIADTLSRPILASIGKYKEDWRKIQLADDETRIVIESLEKGCNPHEVIPSWVNRCFINDYNILVTHRTPKNLERLNRTLELIVVPKSHQLEIIQKAHSEYPHGHYGIGATINVILSCYWWQGIYKMVSDFIKKCKCHQMKKINYRVGPMLPIQWYISKPFELVSIDYLGPLPMTNSGNQFVLIMVDYATCWLEANAYRKQNSVNTIDMIKNTWVPRYGIMENVINDGGGPLVSKDVQEFLKSLNVNQKLTSGYHPKANGKAEANVKIIKNIIRKNIMNNIIDERTWDEFLPTAVFATRTIGKVGSNRPSPSELLFGFQIKTPINQEIDTPELSELQEIRFKIWEGTRKHLEKYISKYEDHYNLNRKKVIFNEGDKVLVLKPGKLKSLESRFNGPFIVESRKGDSYTLKDDNGNHPFRSTVNVERLKKYYDSEIKINDKNDIEEIDDFLPFNANVVNDDSSTEHCDDSEINQPENIIDSGDNIPARENDIIEEKDGNSQTDPEEEEEEIIWVKPRLIKTKTNLIKEIEKHGIGIYSGDSRSDLEARYEAAYNDWYYQKS